MTSPIDVNAAFDSEKFAQLTRREDRKKYLDNAVAAGRMSNLGDRYVVLEGMDRGEIFWADSLTPVTGLDLKQNGETAFYSRYPEWHSLGQIVPEGLKTAQEVLQASGQLYTVRQAPSTLYLPPTTEDGEPTIITVPDSFINYRDDTNEPLGIVGKRYHPVQNIEAYSFLDELLDYGMIAESAGTFNGGRRIFISTRLPEDIIIDPTGVKELIRPYLNIINSHDGSTAVMCQISPWRIRCRNTERFSVRDAYAKWNVRHTKNAMTKIAEARKALGFTQEYYEEFANEETSLLQTEITVRDVDKLIDEITSEWDSVEDAKRKGTEPSKQLLTRRANRKGELKDLYRGYTNEVGGNAYALERSFTDWEDHMKGLRPRGELKESPLMAIGTRLLEGASDERKDVAHKRLMLLTRR